MTESRTLTDLIPGGGTVALTVTASTSNLDIETMVLDAQREQANAVHALLAEQFAFWRRALYEMREQLGGDPAPAAHPSSLAPNPMPGRMRTWDTDDAVWLQFIAPGRAMDLDNAEAVRVPVERDRHRRRPGGGRGEVADRRWCTALLAEGGILVGRYSVGHAWTGAEAVVGGVHLCPAPFVTGMASAHSHARSPGAASRTYATLSAGGKVRSALWGGVRRGDAFGLRSGLDAGEGFGDGLWAGAGVGGDVGRAHLAAVCVGDRGAVVLFGGTFALGGCPDRLKEFADLVFAGCRDVRHTAHCDAAAA
ncbi:hypothetical protein LB823_23155 [Tsukamurella sp. M9C]|uniref:hypothetical protein n=1 Tax=unclassified Tsukamurella TaxID=2633480 RepID=UPI001CCCE432|nr:hypothetical protein [Tsukamurella sp. M9C]MCA0159109.1 hypothetical protein [Tsukamurella sp. M9C]